MAPPGSKRPSKPVEDVTLYHQPPTQPPHVFGPRYNSCGFPLTFALRDASFYKSENQDCNGGLFNDPDLRDPDMRRVKNVAPAAPPEYYHCNPPLSAEVDKKTHIPKEALVRDVGGVVWFRIGNGTFSLNKVNGFTLSDAQGNLLASVQSNAGAGSEKKKSKGLFGFVKETAMGGGERRLVGPTGQLMAVVKCESGTLSQLNASVWGEGMMAAASQEIRVWVARPGFPEPDTKNSPPDFSSQGNLESRNFTFVDRMGCVIGNSSRLLWEEDNIGKDTNNFYVHVAPYVDSALFIATMVAAAELQCNAGFVTPMFDEKKLPAAGGYVKGA